MSGAGIWEFDLFSLKKSKLLNSIIKIIGDWNNWLIFTALHTRFSAVQFYLCVFYSTRLSHVVLTVLSPLRARLRSLPDGGKHLRRLRHRRLSGGRLLLHLPAAQAADPAAHPLLPAQLPGRDHPHDPHHRPPEPPRPVATVQHGHHQLQLGRRRQLHAEVLPRRSGAAAAARLPGVRHHLLVGLHPHTGPSASLSPSPSPLHLPTYVRRHATPLHPHPAAAPPALHVLSERRVPPAAAVLLPPAARRLLSGEGIRRLRTELTGPTEKDYKVFRAREDKYAAIQLVVFGWRARAGSADTESATGGRGIKYNKAAVVERRGQRRFPFCITAHIDRNSESESCALCLLL